MFVDLTRLDHPLLLPCLTIVPRKNFSGVNKFLSSHSSSCFISLKERMTSESTPLTFASTSNGRAFGLPTFVNTNEARRLFSTIPLPRHEHVQRAQSVIASQCNELNRSFQERDVGIRILALLAGLILVVTSFFEFFGEFFLFHIRHALMEAVTCLLGIVMLILESKQLQVPEFYQRYIYTYAYFLKFAWGRGLLYVIAGILEWMQGDWNDIIVGGMCLLVGVLYMVVSRRTARKLQFLCESLASEQVLRAKFDEVDYDGQGRLTLEQFRTLTVSVGQHWTRQECEAAFLYMGMAQNEDVSSETLTFADFRTWWLDWASNPSRSLSSDSFTIV